MNKKQLLGVALMLSPLFFIMIADFLDSPSEFIKNTVLLLIIFTPIIAGGALFLGLL